MTCQEIAERTTDYLERVLPENAVRLWESHVGSCERCARYVAQMRLTIRLTRRLGNPAQPVTD